MRGFKSKSSNISLLSRRSNTYKANNTNYDSSLSPVSLHSPNFISYQVDDHENTCFMSCFQDTCSKNPKKHSSIRDVRSSVTHNGRVISSGNGTPVGKSCNKYNRLKWRFQCWTYNFLERPGGAAKYVYHLPVFILISACSILYILSTLPSFKSMAEKILKPLEIVILVQLTLEFILRLWACGCRSRYQGIRGRIRFAKRFFVILDTIIIMGSLIIVSGLIDLSNDEDDHTKHNHTIYFKNATTRIVSYEEFLKLNSSEDVAKQIENTQYTNSQLNIIVTFTLRFLRFLPIIRIVRMDRRGNSWKLLASVVRAHSRELMTSFYIGFIVILFGSYIVYLRKWYFENC